VQDRGREQRRKPKGSHNDGRHKVDMPVFDGEDAYGWTTRVER